MSVKSPKITPRNPGGQIPPGYLLGRVTRGRQKGPAQLISVQLAAAMGFVTKATLRSLAFLDLSDTPKSYAGAAGQFPQVNNAQTALAFAVAVVPTGSPVSGNLTKFSGVSSVTNGDLSGVVTTSGSLVTTAANPFQIGTPYIRTGNGAGPGTDPEGTLYLRTDNGLAYTQFITSSANPARVQDKTADGTYSATLTSTPTPGNTVIAVGFGEAAPSAASGWTSILTGNDAVAGIGTLYRIVAYRLVQAGDSGAYTPFTGSSAVGVSLHECSGVDQVAFSNSQADVRGGTSGDLGTVSESFTTTSNNNFAILSAITVSDNVNPPATTIGGTTTWTNQSSAGRMTIGSASIATSGTVVNGTAVFSGGLSDRYSGECMITLNPPAVSQNKGLQQLSYLTILKNAGSSITGNARSINFGAGLFASDDGNGNTTVTSAGAITGGGAMASRRGTRGRAGPPGQAGVAGVAGAAGPAGAVLLPKRGIRGRWGPPGPQGNQGAQGAGSGTVTSVATTGGLTGGTITTTGTLQLASVTAHCVEVGTGSNGAPTAVGPGTLGQFLQSQGGSADPAYANTLYLFSTTTTSGSQASVTVSSIPSGWRNMRVIVSGRSDTNATNTTLSVQFNSDTGANYDTSGTQTQSGGATSAQSNFGQTALLIANIAAATAPASDASTIEFMIGNYAGSTFHKDGSYSAGVRTANSSGNLFNNQGHLWWKGTPAAITAVKVFPTAGNFVNGSTVDVYVF